MVRSFPTGDYPCFIRLSFVLVLAECVGRFAGDNQQASNDGLQRTGSFLLFVSFVPFLSSFASFLLFVSFVLFVSSFASFLFFVLFVPIVSSFLRSFPSFVSFLHCFVHISVSFVRSVPFFLCSVCVQRSFVFFVPSDYRRHG